MKRSHRKSHYARTWRVDVPLWARVPCRIQTRQLEGVDATNCFFFPFPIQAVVMALQHLFQRFKIPSGELW